MLMWLNPFFFGLIRNRNRLLDEVPTNGRMQLQLAVLYFSMGTLTPTWGPTHNRRTNLEKARQGAFQSQKPKFGGSQRRWS
jgi:hypothetical protein